MSRIIFFLTESIRALSRARIPALISSITIAITLLIFSMAYYAYVNLIGYSHEFKKQYRIEVFFNPDVEYRQGLELFNKILLIDGIEQGDFVDKEDAAAIFKKIFNKDVIEIIGDNPLPFGGRFEIDEGFRSASTMNSIVNEIKVINGVDDALFSTGLIMRLDRLVSNILGVGILIGIGIFVISIILVSNTIRLIIHAKQDDIHTFTLLGATKLFIKIPFLLEGILQGLIGSGISLLILIFLRSLLFYILGSYRMIIIEPVMLISGNIVAGCLLGLFASHRSISKYLK
ncbi:MAG: hypothetical protein HN729_06890 [Candidatus Marinimicrobia bacterium]|jgi:cell division transport system permease protein|nr:hypothetical protein [Candidatus Neomarinimicrobiota bacterium]MBT3633651.1 hypothetical protein [Candidatus Neomarinimicrobiota bacterium]MBT3682396.1 hypothetical protein [Candidatus Neomarinimicrobiota bacterium]MBT3759160.1 hypothetical protein [Candidatus Neomarinimicrobiota bacterium]MBT3895567.1 hypothetical protein [Candidatus Neomarinimicrobiota bacterium]